MKQEELIPGRWYKVIKYRNLYYKFKASNGIGSIQMAEYKPDTSNSILKEHPCSNPAFWEKGVLATNDELLSFLPSKHPDLNFINTYELW